VTVSLDDGTEVQGDEVLAATGRRPRTDDIGLETVGLQPGSWLEVDESMTVRGVPSGWLYAVGDVNHRALLTHQGKYQARACGDVIAARAKGAVDVAPWGPYAATADHGAVPAVVFTDPEVGGVGLTSAAARLAGLVVRVVDIPIAVAGSSLFADGYQGRASLVVDEVRRVVVGATFVGSGVAELLHSATIAIVGEVPIDRLWHAVPSYPTISEVWLRLLEEYGL
jgi:dihydrolipoamide dehydrogenase